MRKITPNDILITEAGDARDFDQALILFKEYANSLPVDLSFQDFDEELRTIDQQYKRPNGGIFIARHHGGELAGCAAVRKLERDIAELKRMYLRKDFRGIGLGQRLLDGTLNLARQLSYSKIRLDTLPGMSSAMKLYERNGFTEIGPYRYNPVSGTKYYERVL